MQAAPSLEALVANPVGRYFVTSACALVWCHGPTLGGAIAWGRPTCHDVHRILAAFELYRSSGIAPRFATIMDGRGIEAIEPEAFALFVSWLAERRAELAERVDIQFGVVAADSLVGATLSGILPVVGQTHRFRVVIDPLDAFRAVSPVADALSKEVDDLATAARGVPVDVSRLRALLRARPQRGVAGAAAALGVARRTLQRQLARTGTSFSGELREALYERVRQMILGGDEKIAVIARRVGLSEGTLTRLVREKSGRTPGELRRRPD
jgi:AraC-like DNA-binding protein